eukprot:IDg1088t1
MMGYSTQSKGYKLWDANLMKFVVSRDVKFQEADTADELSISIPPSITKPVGSGTDIGKDEPLQCQMDSKLKKETLDTHDVPETQPDETSSPKSALRRSTRKIRAPREWWKFEPSASSPDSIDPDPSTSSDTALIINDPPQSYTEATSSANIDFWAPGIKREEDSIRENNTFTLVEHQPGMHVIPCRYVFKVKNNTPKVRIVAKGFRQVHGVDYSETYAPVVTLATVRVFLSIIATLDLECDQMDVITAFLNGDLEEDIYMQVPSGFKDKSKPNLVCKLHKALYGLKQAPQQWYAKINSFLIDELDFQSCPYEPCLYFKHDKDDINVIVLYVDDLLVAGNKTSTIDKIKTVFKSRFKMKDLGHAQEFLGLEITRDRPNRTLTLSQSGYVDKYSIVIGSLMYLMIGTRPDIAFAVGKLSQHCEKPRLQHWIAAKRVLRYVKGTRNLSITYGTKSSLEPLGYCDSDWGGCVETRKSTEGYLFLIAGGAVCWRSKKQSIIATSTCEAEYVSLCSAAKEAIWLSRLLATVLGKPSPTPITIMVDNEGAIASSHSTSINQRNKHIDMRYHFVREAVLSGLVKIQHCTSEEEAADPLTKPLYRIAFEKHRESFGLRSKVSEES